MCNNCTSSLCTNGLGGGGDGVGLCANSVGGGGGGCGGLAKATPLNINVLQPAKIAAVSFSLSSFHEIHTLSAIDLYKYRIFLFVHLVYH